MEFDVRGIIQLAGNSAAKIEFPQRVSGIKVRLKCRRLHFLQATGGSEREGTQIGSYLVHYTSGDPQEIPIIYGQALRSWHSMRDAVREITDGAEAWSGTNAANYSIRLFRSTWENPRPEAEIASIDFHSAMTLAAPFLIAITAE